MSCGDSPGHSARAFGCLPRRPTRTIQVGGLSLGSSFSIAVQSMVKCSTLDPSGCLSQISRCKAAGAKLMMVAVPDRAAAGMLKQVVSGSPLPLIADIHFDEELVYQSLDAGVAGIRINPATMPSMDALDRIGRACAAFPVAVRVGVNAARSKSSSGATPAGLVNQAEQGLDRILGSGVENVKVSVKASSMALTIEANRILAERCREVPIHLGLTEAGLVLEGAVKSSVALGTLLQEGIGDTIRISLAGPAEQEVRAARALLRALGLSNLGIDLVVCPSCGRSRQDVVGAAEVVAEACEGIAASLTVAVMGCEVNGPGEASSADLGIAGTTSGWMLFVKGEPVEQIRRDEGCDRLVKEVRKLEQALARDQ